MKAFKKVFLSILGIIAVYLMVGYALHLIIFPEKRPDIGTYFEKGQVYHSKLEGFTQTVVSQKNGLVYCNLEIEPFAPGPPKHLHTQFDEVFEVKNGELSIWIDGKIKKVKPGEKLVIPRGTPHRPFNQTADTIRTKNAFPFPEDFAFGLTQVYKLADNHPDFGQMPVTLFMMAPIQQAGFDSYLEEGPPVGFQKTINFLITPAVRLMGYKSYY